MTVVRRAGTADVEALLRLRTVMLTSMGEDVGTDRRWVQAGTTWFTRTLAEPDRCAAFVVDTPDDAGPVACAVGVVDLHAPSPSNPSGAVGHLFNVATLPGARRRGYARATVSALLTWFDGLGIVPIVRLAATPEGAGLYRSLGFTEPSFPVLQRRST